MRLIPHPQSLTEEFYRLLTEKRACPAFGLLVAPYINFWDFDEDWYVFSHDDLHGVIPSKAFGSGWDHFLLVGYLEGRAPARFDVDSDWYMKIYPDVAKAIINGELDSCLTHFQQIGYREGRLAADPMIDCSWYAPRYMRVDSDAADPAKCLEHYMTFGYRGGALPAPV